MYSKLLSLQKAIKPIIKDSENPFFKSKYFDINTLIAELKPILNDLGLVIMQPLTNIDGKTAIMTAIIDIDEDKIISETTVILPENNDPQKMGSIITYFRRYSLQSLLLLEAEDDDAEGAKTTYVSEKMDRPAVNPDLCPLCGASMVFNPKTGKKFCEAKCWLK